MEPYNGFSSSRQDSPSSLTRRLSWSRPSPLPHDAIQHESLNETSNDPYYSQQDGYQSQRRVPRQDEDGNRSFRHDIHSQASDLDSPVYAPGEMDDTVHLTGQNSVWRRSAPYERDLERRRGHRGDAYRHGNREKEGALKAMSKSIKRASVRVVNFANAGLDERPIRLEDVDEHEGVETQQLPIVENVGTLRGKTLGIFGPTNPIRLTMHKLLSST